MLVDGLPARSCLMFGVQADGRSVETVEALGTPDALGPLQQAFTDHHGLQCGFCTPGFLMLVTAFLRETPSPTDEEIREVVASNLCRCTGYQGILRAVRAAADAGVPQADGLRRQPRAAARGSQAACGRGHFADDEERPGQLWMRVVRSPVAHAVLGAVDAGDALKLKQFRFKPLHLAARRAHQILPIRVCESPPGSPR